MSRVNSGSLFGFALLNAVFVSLPACKQRDFSDQRAPTESAVSSSSQAAEKIIFAAKDKSFTVLPDLNAYCNDPDRVYLFGFNLQLDGKFLVGKSMNEDKMQGCDKRERLKLVAPMYIVGYGKRDEKLVGYSPLVEICNSQVTIEQAKDSMKVTLNAIKQDEYDKNKCSFFGKSYAFDLEKVSIGSLKFPSLSFVEYNFYSWTVQSKTPWSKSDEIRETLEKGQQITNGTCDRGGAGFPEDEHVYQIYNEDGSALGCVAKLGGSRDFRSSRYIMLGRSNLVPN